MEEREQNIRLGLFVGGGVLLLLAALFFLGLSSFFVSEEKVYTTFSESVQGLTEGSQVKYRGVPVGSVSDISIAVDDRIVKVEMKIRLDNFINRGTHEMQRQKFADYLRKEIGDGLRCRMEYAGITGMKFIDFDYFGKPEDAVPEAPEGLIGRDDLYLPSVPSTFKDISATLVSAIDRLSNIHFEEISGELESSLQKLSNLLSDPAIRSTIARTNEVVEHLEATASSVEKVFNEDEMQTMRENLNGALRSFRNLAETLDKRTRQIDFHSAQDDYHSLIVQLKQMIDSMRILAEYLETDPQSVLQGKGKQER
ncbi:MAG: MlaD family protein [Victivallaceae bacterium]|nr:MlaD family protein [Victivallaceae bacterium]